MKNNVDYDTYFEKASLFTCLDIHLHQFGIPFRIIIRNISLVQLKQLQVIQKISLTGIT